MEVMSERLTDPREKSWAKLHAVFSLLAVLFYLYNPINKYLWETVRYGYFNAALILSVGLYCFFRGLRGELAQRLMGYYVVWYFLTRLLNGELWLQTPDEARAVWELALCGVLLPVGTLLNAQGRRRLLNWLSLGVVGYLCPVGLVGIYTFFTRRSVYNPITGATIAGVKYPNEFCHLNVTDLNSNISALLFFLAFFLLVYQFFACRRKLWRVLMFPAAAICYLNMAFTFSRNVMINFSLGIGMLALLLIRRAFPVRKLALQAVIAAAVILAALPLGMKSFDLTAALSSRIISRTVDFDYLPEDALEVTDDSFTDYRDFGEDLSTLTLRTSIYKGAFLTAVKDPIRLVKGCLYSHLMDYVNPLLTRPHGHLHNFLLQTVGLTGLPGLLLVLGFCALLTWRMIRIFFSEKAELDFPVRLLTIPLTGVLVYGMLEVPIFGYSDIRAFLFFLLAGIFLGWSYEIDPPASWEAERPPLRSGKRPRLQKKKEE